MKRRSVRLITVLSMLTVSMAAATALPPRMGQVLLNGDFESSAPRTLAGWGIWGAACGGTWEYPPPFVQSRAAAHDGREGLRIALDRRSPRESRIYQEITFDRPVMDASLSGWVRVLQASPTAKLIARMSGYDGEGALKIVESFLLAGRVDGTWDPADKRSIPLLNSIHWFVGEEHFLRRRLPVHVNEKDDRDILWVARPLDLGRGPWQHFSVQSLAAEAERVFGPGTWEAASIRKLRMEMEALDYGEDPRQTAGGHGGPPLLAHMDDLMLAATVRGQNLSRAWQEQSRGGETRWLVREGDSASLLSSPGRLVAYRVNRDRHVAQAAEGRSLTLPEGLDVGSVGWARAGETGKIQTDEYRAEVDLQTGRLIHLISLRPTPRDVMAAEKPGFCLAILDPKTGEIARFDQVLDLRLQAAGNGQRAIRQLADNGGLELELHLASGIRHPTSEAFLRYRFYPDRVDIHAEIVPKEVFSPLLLLGEKTGRSAAGKKELAFSLGIDPDVGETQVFNCNQHFEISCRPDQANVYHLRYADRSWDRTQADKNMYMPYGVIEGKDRLILWGTLDLATFAVMTPNLFGSPAAFSLRPASLEAGQKYTFDVTLKTFPKPDNTYTEVLRWYLQNVFSTDPLSAGIATMTTRSRAGRQLADPARTSGNATARERPFGSRASTSDEPKTLFEGNLTGARPITSQIQTGVGWYVDPAFLQSLFLRMIWYGGWPPWNDTMPTSGEWKNQVNEPRSAEMIRQDIREMQDQGFKVLMYFRQFLNTAHVFDDRPPYRSWLNGDKFGKLMTYQRWDAEGQENYRVFADFGNPEFVRWYIDQVKACIDYYRPDGIAWDMGWCDLDSTSGFSTSHPESGYHHGMLRVFYEVWRYVKTRYPNMVIVDNNQPGLPTSLYADGTLFEGGIGPGHWIRDYQAAKAQRLQVIHYDYGSSIEEMKTGFALGSTPNGFSPMMTFMAQMSARANALPMVVEHQAIEVDARLPSGRSRAVALPEVRGGSANWRTARLRVDPREAQIFRTAWAGDREAIVAVYNREPNPLEATIRLRAEFFRRYGNALDQPFRVTRIGDDGVPVEGTTERVAREAGGDLVLRTHLGPRDLLLFDSPPRDLEPVHVAGGGESAKKWASLAPTAQLENGGFETGGIGGWDLLEEPSQITDWAKRLVVTDRVHSGKFAVRLHSDKAFRVGGALYQDFTSEVFSPDLSPEAWVLPLRVDGLAKAVLRIAGYDAEGKQRCQVGYMLMPGADHYVPNNQFWNDIYWAVVQPSPPSNPYPRGVWYHISERSVEADFDAIFGEGKWRSLGLVKFRLALEVWCRPEATGDEGVDAYVDDVALKCDTPLRRVNE